MKKRAYVDLGFACVDTGRQTRRGFPEVVFCQKKTKEEILKIARQLDRDRDAPLLLTRLDARVYAFLKSKLKGLSYDTKARAAFRKGRRTTAAARGEVLIVTAGTSDIPVAEEAALTLDLMGVSVRKLYDVGVAGVHRVIDRTDILRRAAVIIVVAGMEGALASLVSGLVGCPVVAVPTSCGYGSSFEGLSALLTMLNSCSPGIAVMNIDNGFGAGYFAGLVVRR
ncbi:MAG: nickel pincer cofactor biosynthesis protein LarB [Candidatus Omnitrophota bacterium]|jgi:hypothetical protein|nr:nickel pincer cofactor biosynthesis protein LarB [Candidatus Omnitrophota bacterium]MDD5537538.1 nickel pincer cofactor biosynthesis protein LarB [Candidatus Omnitrophota bacterium]